MISGRDIPGYIEALQDNWNAYMDIRKTQESN